LLIWCSKYSAMLSKKNTPTDCFSAILPTGKLEDIIANLQ